MRALLEAATAGQNPLRDRAMILLLLDTGLRASELCGLRVEDVSWPGRRLVVTGKADKERYLRFSPVTLEAVQASLAGRRSGPLFCNRQHTALDRHAVRLLFRRLGLRAGVLRCHPHRMRHTFAIQFLRNEGNVYALQAAMGHSTLDMVKWYLEIVQADIDVQMDKASPVARWEL
jgi:site-specific recombinase XerD